MFAPIFEKVAADPASTALIGAAPTRLYPAGQAPEDVTYPYSTWTQIGGSPENYITNRPDIDLYTLQVDVWAKTLGSARNVATALRDVIETHAHIVRWGGESRDNETGSYRISFDADWFVHR